MISDSKPHINEELAPGPPAVGGELRVLLVCPDCGVKGWAAWKDLHCGLRCAKCGCQFLLNRTGKLQSVADLPHIRYSCPRCKQSGSLPEMFAVHKAECTICGLSLVRGPDQRLHDAAETRRLLECARREGRKSSASRAWAAYWMTPNGRWRRVPAALTVAAIVAIVGLGIAAMRQVFHRSVEGQVRQFTLVCLAGDWNAAHDFMAEDALQQAEFNRWRARYFTSIRDEYRPAGDRVTVDVEAIDESPRTRIFRVAMTSPFIGRRTHEQHWQQANGRWLFDALRTLDGLRQIDTGPPTTDRRR